MAVPILPDVEAALGCSIKAYLEDTDLSTYASMQEDIFAKTGIRPSRSSLIGWARIAHLTKLSRRFQRRAN